VNTWKPIKISINPVWASKQQQATYDALQARITSLEAKQNDYDVFIASGQAEPLTTLVSWGNTQHARATLLIEELKLRQDCLTYLETDRQEQQQYRQRLAVQIEVERENTLAKLQGIGYTMDCLQGCDAILRHPKVKALRLEIGMSYDNSPQEEQQDAINQLTAELQTLRNRKVM